jgi:hypothetical protein
MKTSAAVLLLIALCMMVDGMCLAWIASDGNRIDRAPFSAKIKLTAVVGGPGYLKARVHPWEFKRGKTVWHLKKRFFKVYPHVKQLESVKIPYMKWFQRKVEDSEFLEPTKYYFTVQ